MVVVISRIPDAKVSMLVPDGLEARERIGKYTDPFMVLECRESRVYGDEFRPHDSAGFFRPSCVYVYSGSGGYVDYCRPEARLSLYV